VDGQGALAGEPASVALDGRGNYYVAQFKQRYVITQFNPTGQFVRTIGREGRGPGEYLYIVSLTIGPNDSLYVVDHGNARIAVLSPDHEASRTIPFAGQFFSALVTRAGIIANAHWPRAESLGKPLRTTGMDGSVKAVYGATTPHFNPRAVYSVMRSIAAGQDSSIWAGEKTRYVVEEWSVNGKPLRTITRNVPWFPAYEQRMKATAARPSEPWLVALREERSGRLWTAITVPDSEWSKRWTELGFTEEKGVEPDQRIFDTIIEVLDLNRKAVVFSQRLPHYIHGFLNDSTAFGYSVDSDEIPHIEIWRFRLVER
jgi:hypothetical protein